MKFQFGFCILLVLIYKSCSYTLEQVIRESVEKGLKSLTQLKRQLPDDMDEDSREMIRNVDYSTTRDEVPDPLPTPARRAIVTHKKGDSDKAKGENKNCSCEIHRQHQDGPKISKYRVELNKDDDEKNRSQTRKYEPTLTTTLHPTPTYSLSKVQLNETHFELKELEFQLEAAMKEVCPHYKNGPELDIDSMADVWQLAHYKASDALSCFKIFLKKTSPLSRKRNRAKYTSFNDSIDWRECYLELGSTGKPLDNRRHFLQGSKNDKGVLDNIVLAQSVDTDNQIVITLLDQSPDQWLVTNNLLLMRDCDSGDVVVFIRISTKPELKEMIEAMNDFGENGMNDTMPCLDHKDDDISREHAIISSKKYYTLS